MMVIFVEIKIVYACSVAFLFILHSTEYTVAGKRHAGYEWWINIYVSNGLQLDRYRYPAEISLQ